MTKRLKRKRVSRLALVEDVFHASADRAFDARMREDVEPVLLDRGDDGARHVVGG